MAGGRLKSNGMFMIIAATPQRLHPLARMAILRDVGLAQIKIGYAWRIIASY